MIYAEWIAAYVERHGGHVRGLCYSATIDMIAAFPELRRVRGHVGVVSPRTEHWWCEAPGGVVVDPTATQFTRVGGPYLEHSGPEPVGLCRSCAGYVWVPYNGERSVCSKACADYLKEAE